MIYLLELRWNVLVNERATVSPAPRHLTGMRHFRLTFCTYVFILENFEQTCSICCLSKTRLAVAEEYVRVRSYFSRSRRRQRGTMCNVGQLDLLP